MRGDRSCLAAVAPVAARVDIADARPGAVREQPELWRRRVEATPRVAAQN